jgi:hypothetical protein
MITLSQITMPHMTVAKVKEFETIGEAKKYMNSLKQANKSSLYCIHDGTRLISSMINK